MIVVDTGPVVAMGNRRDADHERCTRLLTSAEGPLLLPEPLLSEIGYMLWRSAGSQVEADFLRDVGDGVYELVSLSPSEVHRVAGLVATYRDLPLGTADASVLAVAERMQVVAVATLDRRHFTVVRPSHVEALTLLP